MELQTERLYIRSLRESDWPALQKIWMDFEGSAYAVYDAPLPTDAKGAKALTQKFADSGLFFAICLPDRPAGPVMGYVGFHKEGQSFDLGYCFHSAYQGRGYAYESAKALIGRLAKEYPGAVFTAGTALENTPSCSLLRRLGFACISTETVSFDGKFSFRGGHFMLENK